MKYSLIDTHCDTIKKAFDQNGSLFKNTFHVDLDRCNFSEYTQFFAAFIHPMYKDRAHEHAIDLIGKFKTEVKESNGKIAFCKSFADYLENKGKIKAFLSLEGGDPIGDLETLDYFYDEGIRLIALTWNHSNHIAGGADDVEGKCGLSDFGKCVVERMDEIGIITDVSHLNDRSFWEVLECSKKPVIASHSNSRKICNHRRNLTDEQFLAIKERNGYVGINLYPPFLNESGVAKISDVISHIEHFLSLGGENNIGIGADFDGVESLPHGITGFWDIYKIFDEMLRNGYSEDIINKISHTNMERVLQEIL